MSRPTSPGRCVRYAWLSLLGYVLSFAVSFALGGELASSLGGRFGDPAASTYPMWVIAVSVIASLIVFAIPGFLAWHFGRKAAKAGDTRGRLPGWLGLGIAFGFAVMNVVALFVPAR